MACGQRCFTWLWPLLCCGLRSGWWWWLSSSSVVSDSLRPCGLQHARLPSPSLSPGVCSNSCPTIQPSNHLILCCPLLLPPSIFPSVRVFSNESALRIRWPKYWNFRFHVSSSNENSGLISFRIDWFDLAVQGTLKSFFQHCSSKASLLWLSVFFKGGWSGLLQSPALHGF